MSHRPCTHARVALGTAWSRRHVAFWPARSRGLRARAWRQILDGLAKSRDAKGEAVKRRSADTSASPGLKQIKGTPAAKKGGRTVPSPLPSDERSSAKKSGVRRRTGTPLLLKHKGGDAGS